MTPDTRRVSALQYVAPTVRSSMGLTLVSQVGRTTSNPR